MYDFSHCEHGSAEVGDIVKSHGVLQGGQQPDLERTACPGDGCGCVGLIGDTQPSRKGHVRTEKTAAFRCDMAPDPGIMVEGTRVIRN